MKNLWFLLLLLLMACGAEDDVVSCDSMEINLESIGYANCGNPDGIIDVVVTGGTAPYTYQLNDSTVQDSSTFVGLRSQFYTVKVQDANGCIDSVRTFMGSIEGVKAIALTRPSGCNDNKGSIRVVARNGKLPYRYQIGENENYTNEDTFYDLPAGEYSVWVKDVRDCFLGIYPVVLTGVSLEEDIMPLITAECATEACHGGGQSPSLGTTEEVKKHAEEVIMTASADPNHQGHALTAEDLQLINCWVNDLELEGEL